MNVRYSIHIQPYQVVVPRKRVDPVDVRDEYKKWLIINIKQWIPDEKMLDSQYSQCGPGAEVGWQGPAGLTDVVE